MKCKKCKYYYETDCNKSTYAYNPLGDNMQTITVVYKGPCCGYTPGGVALDREQPICSNYEEKEK